MLSAENVIFDETPACDDTKNQKRVGIRKREIGKTIIIPDGSAPYIPKSRQFTTLSGSKFFRSHSLVYSRHFNSNAAHQIASSEPAPAPRTRRSADPPDKSNLANYGTITENETRDDIIKDIVHIKRTASQDSSEIRSSNCNSCIKRLLMMLGRCWFAEHTTDQIAPDTIKVTVECDKQSVTIQEYLRADLEKMCHYDELSFNKDLARSELVLPSYSLAQELIRPVDEASAFSPVAAAFVYSD